MNLDLAKAEIMDLERKIRLLDTEIKRVKKIRLSFVEERNKIKAFLDLLPTYVEANEVIPHETESPS